MKSSIPLKCIYILFIFIFILPGILLALEFPEGLPISFHFKDSPKHYSFRIMSIPPAVRLDPNQDWIGIFSSANECVGGGPWKGIQENGIFLNVYADRTNIKSIMKGVVFRIWKADKKRVYAVKVEKSDVLIEAGEGVNFLEIFPLGMNQMSYEILFENKVRVVNNELKYSLWFLKKEAKNPAFEHILLLKMRWEQVEDDFEAVPPVIFQNDVHWFGDLSEINRAISQAKGHAEASRFSPAVSDLKTISQIMSDLRSRNRVILFGDLMLAFQKSLEDIIELVEQGASHGYTTEIWDKIDDKIPVLYLGCFNVTRFVPKGLEEENEARYYSFGSELERSVRDVEVSVKERDYKSLLENIKEAERVFWGFYLIYA